MKKYLFPLIPTLILCSQAIYAETLQENIVNVQTEIKTLELELKSMQELEALLPTNVQQRKADILAAQIKEDVLKTHTEFGFISTSGNTNTEAYALDFTMKKGWSKHKVESSLDGQFTEDNKIEIKNKFLGELQYNYAFTPLFSFSYLAGYKEDKFSGYDYQFYTGAGAKYKLIKEEIHNLSFESNILYSQDQIENSHFTSAGIAITYPNPNNLVEDASRTIDADKETYTSVRIKTVYEWKVSKNLKFIQDITYRIQVEDTKNYFLLTKTALTSKISDVLSLGLSYKIDYANRPPESKENADKTLTANLIIDY